MYCNNKETTVIKADCGFFINIVLKKLIIQFCHNQANQQLSAYD